MKKRPGILKRAKKSAWQRFQGGNRKFKCYDYILSSKYNK